MDGTLRNARGEAFVMEMPRSNTLFDSYFYNLAKVGITLRDSRMPGPELLRSFDSQQADVPGSETLAGLESPVVDALIHALLDADSAAARQAAARALDRVLIHGHYVLPYR